MSLAGVLRACAVCIASGFGSGLSAIAPGTSGSFAALALWWLVFGVASGGAVWPLALVLITSIVGVVAVAGSLDPNSSDPDPRWIVIDEWAGLYVALVGVAPGEFSWIVCAFVLFRFFDASKVGPVGWAEALPGSWGIMADDLVAGALAAICVWAARVIV